MYRNQEADIKINTAIKTVDIQKGIRQGRLLSPSLFDVNVEQVLKDIKHTLEEEKLEVTIGRTQISTIRFADGIVLFATSEKDLQRGLHEMDNIFLTFE